MLSNLQIENVAVIKKAVIDFRDGFNVMSGETGAGKSIIIDSLNAVLGERTSRELIRSDSSSALVSAVFYDNSSEVKSILNEFDIEPEDDGSIIISRKMTEDGKNICKINGMSATVSMLKRLGKQLVNIHGQLDNQSLLNPDNHCSYVDRIAENSAVLDDFKLSFNKYSEALKQLNSLEFNEEQKARRLDILNFQIDELEKAKIRVGEWEKLKQKQQLFRNSERILELLNTSYTALNGSDETEGAVSLGFTAAKCLQNAANLSENFESLSKNIEDSVYELSAYCDEVRNLLDGMEFDESDIDAVEERLDLLYRLSKKYGATEEDMLEFYSRAVEERNGIENADELREKLKKQVSELYNEAFTKAKELSKTRKKAGGSFSVNVCEELKFLDMPSVKFYVNIDETEMNENGIDSVEFFLSANAGEAPKPLHKIASGGELSRIMLAIKSVLADKDNIGTLVFDEIDTGVSGRAAQKIAMKLKQVSSTHQVICVTHLAQIAAFADEHMLIEKTEKDGKTFTELRSLDYIGRKYELARIMGGLTVTESQLKSADELLIGAGIKK